MTLPIRYQLVEVKERSEEPMLRWLVNGGELAVMLANSRTCKLVGKNLFWPAGNADFVLCVF